MKTIRTRLAAIIIGLALIGSLSTLAIPHFVANQMSDTALDRESEAAQQRFLAALDAESIKALALATLVSEQVNVQQAMATGDRETLAAQFVAGFEVLRDSHNIRQFQFHLAPATSFLRVHRPERFGDDLSGFRQTILDANASVAPISGLEAGIAGIGVRGVVPIEFEGNHVGSVEFGLGLTEQFIATFSASTGNPTAIVRPGAEGPEVIGSTLPNDMDALDLVGATEDGALISPSGVYFVDRLEILDFTGQPLATAIIAVDRSAYTAIASNARMMGMGFAVLLLCLAGGVLWFATRSVLDPLKQVTGAMLALADGDPSCKVSGEARPDEVGDIARAVVVCQANRVDQVRLGEEQAAAEQGSKARQKRVESLINAFEQVAKDHLQAAEEVNAGLQETSKELEVLAGQSSQQADDAAAASQEASGNVQTVASASEELSSSIDEISGQVHRTSDIVKGATQGALDSNEKVAGLASAASKIGEVVTLIQDIAEQTNLLALNATIEAARAGESGKGFAVVAAEVKELANQTAKATEEISLQVQGIQASSDSAVEAIGGIAQSIEEVNGFTGAIATAVSQQGSATNEISASIQSAAGQTNILVGNIERLSGAVGSTSQAAASVLAASKQADETTTRLRTEIAKFLSDVAAA